MISTMSFSLMAPEAAKRLTDAELTYSEVGQTSGVLPRGYHHLHQSKDVGYGAQALSDAARALLSWQLHEQAGLCVSPSSATARPGTVLRLTLHAGLIGITVPCRVVYVVDEPDRQGFAYGTLPGHPESGEEAFILRRSGTGVVTFTITAFSRPATLAARAAGPAGRAVQRYITSRYLRALPSLQLP